MRPDAGERPRGWQPSRLRGRRPAPGRPDAPGLSGAFTLLEILLALALLGLLAAALVSGAVHLVGTGARSPQELFWEASRTARRTALNAQHEVTLGFDQKERQFVVDDAGAVQTYPVPGTARELTIDFLQAQATGGSVLIGGQLVDTAKLERVTFYADGTCTPFRVQFRGAGPATILAIDPWTCAPVLTEETTR